MLKNYRLKSTNCLKIAEDKLFQKMAFIIGHKRERDVGRLEKRHSGKFRISEWG